MGLIYAGLIPLPSFSPFWLDKMHTGEQKKSMSQQVKVVNVGGAANIQLSMRVILFCAPVAAGTVKLCRVYGRRAALCSLKIKTEPSNPQLRCICGTGHSMIKGLVKQS